MASPGSHDAPSSAAHRGRATRPAWLTCGRAPCPVTPSRRSATGPGSRATPPLSGLGCSSPISMASQWVSSGPRLAAPPDGPSPSPSTGAGGAAAAGELSPRTGRVIGTGWAGATCCCPRASGAPQMRLAGGRYGDLSRPLRTRDEPDRTADGQERRQADARKGRRQPARRTAASRRRPGIALGDEDDPIARDACARAGGREPPLPAAAVTSPTCLGRWAGGLLRGGRMSRCVGAGGIE
jgi:hypothetical protein